ncbi:hypothetical protein DSM19430T_29750 [Desulfovibrio psychrotolerans]|uniref:WYL domain-containing protein n=1 Tax=Desulfovibrio psychrotolerans TaxID=415242 RepID=A0A7J0BYR1_9BACT|nr:hypothetical protein DSM19430T_29750 [Desulfovibrio psychrotolerans]
MLKDIICEAINTRSELRVFYNGGYRTIEPHRMGIANTENTLLRCFQTSGYSESGETVGWKLFNVRNMRDVSPTGVHFLTPRPEYTLADSAMHRVICEL